MKRKQSAILTAVLVDYDNIYLSLKRRSDEAAKRFAKESSLWLKEIASGRLITTTNATPSNIPRRIVLNRCYGNPIPRRNTHDNSTDMSSFPFVRHHFLRAGFEVVDCPPLTAQQKNASDIRMVMDVRDFLQHDTYFDEFVILSGDADFTPVMHRLRAHARRTVIFANDHTAAPYTAISDGEVRESDLITLLIEGRIGSGESTEIVAPQHDLELVRSEIMAEVTAAISSSAQALPLEALADRAVRLLGHEKTAGTSWGGAGSFRELLSQSLPEHIKLSDQPPYVAIDTRRQIAKPAPAPAALAAPEALPAAVPQATVRPAQGLHTQSLHGQHEQSVAPVSVSAPVAPAAPMEAAASANRGLGIEWPADHRTAALAQSKPVPRPAVSPAPLAAPSAALPERRSQLPAGAQLPLPQHINPQQPLPSFSDTLSAAPQRASAPQPAPTQHASAVQPAASGAQSSGLRPSEGATALQQSIARIHEACQAPPLSPPEYRLLFELSAKEITERGLAGAQTITNIAQRAQELGLDIRRDDVRFVLEVVSETDPWFEQGASPNIFAGRFRNFVVARCRSQGLNLSADELDLIEAWFVSGSQPASGGRPSQPQTQPQHQAQPHQQPAQAPDYAANGGATGFEEGATDDDFPRFVRNRLRG
jgi:uncharacterized LabA/DUF88 family protein